MLSKKSLYLVLITVFVFCCHAYGQSAKRKIGEKMKAINILLDNGRFKEAASKVDEIISTGTLIPPELMYEYAKIYGLADAKVKSLNLLNQAIDKGFWSINRVKEDQQLKTILVETEMNQVLKRITGITAPYVSGKAVLTKEEKKSVIDLVRRGLKTHYFDLKLADEMSAEVLHMYNNGFFNGKDTLSVFTEAIRNYLLKKTNDKHFYIGVDYGELIERVPSLSLTTEEERNFGFREVAVRNGNIGYIRWDECIAGTNAYETAQNALGLLRHTRAIIIDISENGGGNGEISTFLYHYLFKPTDKRYESLLVKKCKGESEWHRSEPPIESLSGGPDLGDKPIYIVTSGNTFSAAEYFAFMMKELGRATIVGKNTGGGGNPVSLISDGRFMMYVPTCQIMTSTGKSLEGKGVLPDIEFVTEDWTKEVMQVVNNDLEKKTK